MSLYSFEHATAPLKPPKSFIIKILTKEHMTSYAPLFHAKNTARLSRSVPFAWFKGG